MFSKALIRGLLLTRQHLRENRPSIGQGRKSGKKVERIFLMLIESGFIYSISGVRLFLYHIDVILSWSSDDNVYRVTNSYSVWYTWRCIPPYTLSGRGKFLILHLIHLLTATYYLKGIYPTVVFLIVCRQRSFEGNSDISANSMSNVPNHTRNGRISTIRFDVDMESVSEDNSINPDSPKTKTEE